MSGASQVQSALIDRLPQLLHELLGKPAAKTGTEWRYRRKGSLSVRVDGAKAGQWFDHEAGHGGGFVALVAHELGCDIVKLFPGSSVGGPDFVKAVKGPMPWVKIMPTGGVDPDEASIAKWFGAGIVAAGMGSKLVTDEAVKSGDWAAIEASVRSAVNAVAAFRASKKG